MFAGPFDRLKEYAPYRRSPKRKLKWPFWIRVADPRFEGRRALTRHRGESPVHRKSAGKSSPKGQGRELHSRRQLTKSGGGIPPRVKEPVEN